MADYTPIVLTLVVVTLLAVLIVGLNAIIGIKKGTLEKLSSYESGIEPLRVEKSRLSVRYYLVAILFIVFDVEIIFMYPWAVGYFDLPLIGLIPMVTFMLLMFVGYIYVIKKRALEWN